MIEAGSRRGASSGVASTSERKKEHQGSCFFPLRFGHKVKGNREFDYCRFILGQSWFILIMSFDLGSLRYNISSRLPAATCKNLFNLLAAGQICSNPLKSTPTC